MPPRHIPKIPDSYEPVPAGLPYATYNIGGAAGPEWDEIRAHGSSMALRAGTCFEPDSPDYFYGVERGRLRLEYVASSGRARSLLAYGPGAMLNLSGAILGERSHGYFRVLEDSVLWRLPASLVASPDAPGRCPRLTSYCLYNLSSIIQTYYVGLTFLEVDSFRMRFCRYLLLNIRRFGCMSFSLGITQEECACTLGVHRATLARTVQELKRAGVLGCFTRDCVHILDGQALRRLAGV